MFPKKNIQYFFDLVAVEMLRSGGLNHRQPISDGNIWHIIVGLFFRVVSSAYVNVFLLLFSSNILYCTAHRVYNCLAIEI